MPTSWASEILQDATSWANETLIDGTSWVDGGPRPGGAHGLQEQWGYCARYGLMS